jgi:hypothetical protein
LIQVILYFPLGNNLLVILLYNYVSLRLQLFLKPSFFLQNILCFLLITCLTFMSLILLAIILITLGLVERVIFIFQIMHWFFIYLWTIEWCLPVFVLRFRWTWRANRLLTILSAFRFLWFILLSVTFSCFRWIDCVFDICFFWNTRINKLKITYLAVKKIYSQLEPLKRLQVFLSLPSKILFFDEAASSFTYCFATKQASLKHLRF